MSRSDSDTMPLQQCFEHIKNYEHRGEKTILHAHLNHSIWSFVYARTNQKLRMKPYCMCCSNKMMWNRTKAFCQFLWYANVPKAILYAVNVCCAFSRGLMIEWLDNDFMVFHIFVIVTVSCCHHHRCPVTILKRIVFT